MAAWKVLLAFSKNPGGTWSCATFVAILRVGIVGVSESAEPSLVPRLTRANKARPRVAGKPGNEAKLSLIFLWPRPVWERESESDEDELASVNPDPC